MMEFSRRSYDKELLDGSNIPFADIRKNLEELEIINKYLGGHRITIEGFRKLTTGNDHHEGLDVCEIGCGGGDNLKAVHSWCKRHGIKKGQLPWPGWFSIHSIRLPGPSI
jgi:hypothetical protein